MRLTSYLSIPFNNVATVALIASAIFANFDNKHVRKSTGLRYRLYVVKHEINFNEFLY